MPRGTATPSRRAPALPPGERRDTIIRATEPLLAEFGEAVTSRQIAEAAGVAEGTIFRVFEDKDDLLASTVEAALDTARFEAALADIDDSLPFEQRLVLATEIVSQRIVHIWRLVSNLGPRLRGSAERPLADSEALAAIFEPEAHRLSVDPPKAARILRALTLSTTHPMLAVEPMSPAEIVAVLLHGIGGER